MGNSIPTRIKRNVYEKQNDKEEDSSSFVDTVPPYTTNTITVDQKEEEEVSLDLEVDDDVQQEERDNNKINNNNNNKKVNSFQCYTANRYIVKNAFKNKFIPLDVYSTIRLSYSTRIKVLLAAMIHNNQDIVVGYNYVCMNDKYLKKVVLRLLKYQDYIGLQNLNSYIYLGDILYNSILQTKEVFKFKNQMMDVITDILIERITRKDKVLKNDNNKIVNDQFSDDINNIVPYAYKVNETLTTHNYPYIARLLDAGYCISDY